MKFPTPLAVAATVEIVVPAVSQRRLSASLAAVSAVSAVEMDVPSPDSASPSSEGTLATLDMSDDRLDWIWRLISRYGFTTMLVVAFAKSVYVPNVADVVPVTGSHRRG